MFEYDTDIVESHIVADIMVAAFVLQRRALILAAGPRVANKGCVDSGSITTLEISISSYVPYLR